MGDIGALNYLLLTVLFVLELKTRTVHIAGIVQQPDESWVVEVGRNLTDAVDRFLLGKTRLILDRVPAFAHQFRRLLRDSGVQLLRLPASSPTFSAYAERFVGSIRRQCLDRFVVLGESHLRSIVTEYVTHYHLERNHQSLGNALLQPAPQPANDNGQSAADNASAATSSSTIDIPPSLDRVCGQLGVVC